MCDWMLYETIQAEIYTFLVLFLNHLMPHVGWVPPITIPCYKLYEAAYFAGYNTQKGDYPSKSRDVNLVLRYPHRKAFNCPLTKYVTVRFALLSLNYTSDVQKASISETNVTKISIDEILKRPLLKGCKKRIKCQIKLQNHQVKRFMPVALRRQSQRLFSLSCTTFLKGLGTWSCLSSSSVS